jgi:urease accessory protein
MRRRPRTRMAIVTHTIPRTTMPIPIITATTMAPIAAAATIIRMAIRTATATSTIMATGMKKSGEPPPGDAGTLPLLIWLSPAFPVGAFAYSHGIEWAFEAGDVTDAATTQSWIADLLHCGGPWSDAVLLGAAHRAVEAGDSDALRATAEFAAALAPSRERRLETLAQGDAFMVAIRSAWNNERFERAATAAGAEVAYPVAVGIAAASHRMPLAAVLEAYLLALAGNLVSAAVRLVPLGQSDGSRIVAHLLPLAREIAARAGTSTLDDAGGAAIRSDIASMKHETQYTRLFRS